MSPTTSVLVEEEDLVRNIKSSSTMVMMNSATSAPAYNESNSEAKIIEDEERYDKDLIKACHMFQIRVRVGQTFLCSWPTKSFCVTFWNTVNFF